MPIPQEIQLALHRQRRFLVLMSLAVIIFYALGVSVTGDAQYSGLAIALDHPERVAAGLWVIWVWAFWRYSQQVYALLSAIWTEVLEAVYTEDRRIALSRAKKVGNKLVIQGHFDGIPKLARIRDRVNIKAPEPGDIPNDVMQFRDFLPSRDRGRTYPTLMATFDWVEGGEAGSVDERFKMEVTPRQVRWLRVRAWVHSMIRLPAFMEYIAPFLMAGYALLSPFIYSEFCQ